MSILTTMNQSIITEDDLIFMKKIDDEEAERKRKIYRADRRWYDREAERIRGGGLGTTTTKYFRMSDRRYFKNEMEQNQEIKKATETIYERGTGTIINNGQAI